MEVVKNPTGHKIIDQSIAAAITDSGGDALVTLAYHGLGTGDYVYITSDIDEYNGFWYVTSINTDTFKIAEYATADFVSYYQDADIEYYQTNSHEWNSIFLPIIYKISNDKWPVNTVDTARTISSFSNDNGYSDLTLSGDIGSVDAYRLEFVKISDATDEDLNGVWQIVEVISQSNIVIDLPYSVSNSFSGASIQYYYNSYQVKVKIYSGLNALHPWTTHKPYEEVGILSLTPDENNIVMFSVNDYIKKMIAVKNNLTLFSLPLNLDAFTAFFIQFAESYDESDNYSLSTLETAYETDDFEGYAVAGKLPFKNIYSGAYSDYVYTDGSPAYWLTLFPELLAVEDKYFDISFIKNIPGLFWVIIEKYVQDYLTATETIIYTDQGLGVYRIPIVPDAQYDRFCVKIYTPGQAAVPGVTSAITLPALSLWASDPGSGDEVWTTGATPSINLPGSIIDPSDSEFLFAAYAFIPGYDYTITIGYTVSYNSGSSNPRTARISIFDDSMNVQFTTTDSGPISPGGSDTVAITFTATMFTTRVGVKYTSGSDIDLQIDTRAGTETTPATPEVDAAYLTEEICINIIDACDTQSAVPEDIRLLEDGDYRLLE
jgi:hypothetical protein